VGFLLRQFVEEHSERFGFGQPPATELEWPDYQRVALVGEWLELLLPGLAVAFEPVQGSPTGKELPWRSKEQVLAVSVAFS
jgi:hypothetical protein